MVTLCYSPQRTVISSYSAYVEMLLLDPQKIAGWGGCWQLSCATGKAWVTLVGMQPSICNTRHPKSSQNEQMPCLSHWFKQDYNGEILLCFNNWRSLVIRWPTRSWMFHLTINQGTQLKDIWKPKEKCDSWECVHFCCCADCRGNVRNYKLISRMQ